MEPVAPIRKVLSRNLRRCANTEILPYALGTESKPIVMANDSARETGYFGTGQNFVLDKPAAGLALVGSAAADFSFHFGRPGTVRPRDISFLFGFGFHFGVRVSGSLFSAS